MPSTYKTPGVYVEEVSTFPPSVAPVATAIPAFIGYTKMALKNGESITNVPTKISSFVEFAQLFGGAPDRGIVIRLNAQNQFVSSESQIGTQKYYLYDSIRLFYDNGGGDCYIVSVGGYADSPDIGATAPVPTGILGGLKVLEKYDEPTLIVSPDATLIDSDMYSYQQQALAQCSKLQDRFLIGDLLLNNEAINGETFDERVEQFRNAVGINNLKYGAAYAPWLKANLSANLKFRDVLFASESTVLGNITQATSRGILFGMTSDQEVRNIILDLESASQTSISLEQMITPGHASSILDGSISLEGALKSLHDTLSTFLSTFTDADGWAAIAGDGSITDLYDKFVSVIASIDSVYSGLSPNGATGDFMLQSDIETLRNALVPVFTGLATHHQQIDAESGSTVSLMTSNADFTAAVNLLGIVAANPGAVQPNTITLNEYFTEEAIGELYAYFNSDLIPDANGEATANDAFILIDSTLPANLANEINSTISPFINPTPPADQTALNALINGSAMNDLSKAVAVAYTTAQTASGIAIGDVQANLLGKINAVVENARNAASNANIAGATVADVANSITPVPTPIASRINLAANGARNAISSVAGFFSDVLEAAQSYESTFGSSLKDAFGTYKTLLDRADSDIMVLPPSSAMAGIYTKVDNDRGVWKAPANVSLASVSGPYVNINANEQENLNVDVNAGKSINAIRAFTGKGVLVWGARTLAGNDNEWRYVPVRRFFNFAEESIKKATEQFVFEPNDANTWVKVRAMIENFLTLQWRAGALAGAKPNHAFFVKVGLGETMTALDILEGRMIVEIGMAVVRPAEFIILRFSHKMQES